MASSTFGKVKTASGPLKSISGITTSVIVTSQTAVYPPSTDWAVIFTTPGLAPVTTPSSTVAMPVSELLQVTCLLSAFTGEILAARIAFAPACKRKEDLLREMDVTCITGISGSSPPPPEGIVAATKTSPG